MTATAQKLEQAFKKLPPGVQAELFNRLETIVYAERKADRISLERSRELENGRVSPLSEREVMRRVRAGLNPKPKLAARERKEHKEGRADSDWRLAVRLFLAEIILPHFSLRSLRSFEASQSRSSG